MEKLIELLNEYEYDKRREKTLRGMTNGCLYYIQSINSYLNLKIISKEYGFIKWLVDNDKIDKEFEDKNFLGDIFDSGYRYNNSFIEDRLLCYLALTDEPIEFLISILK